MAVQAHRLGTVEVEAGTLEHHALHHGEMAVRVAGAKPRAIGRCAGCLHARVDAEQRRPTLARALAQFAWQGHRLLQGVDFCHRGPVRAGHVGGGEEGPLGRGPALHHLVGKELFEAGGVSNDAVGVERLQPQRERHRAAREEAVSEL